MASRNRPIMRRSVVIFAILGLVVVVISLAIVELDVIPPRAMTISAIDETSARIELYFQRNKKLPTDLSMLPLREGYMNSITDGWKHPLMYTIDADDIFTLS